MTTATKTRKTAALPPITVPLDIDRGIIRDALLTAWEHGSGYWAIDIDTHAPPKANLMVHGVTVNSFVDYPLSRGGYLLVTADEHENKDEAQGRWRLDLDAIGRGLCVMAKHHPRHFGNLLANTGNTEAADVFVQCCLFGKIVFG
jgi:hypothetical protein